MADSFFSDRGIRHDDSFTSGIGLTAPSILLPEAKPIGLTGWLAAHAGDRAALQDAMSTGIREQLRAALVKAALDNVAALSALEAHLQVVAPSGSERYRTILDAYSVSLAMKLARG